MTASAVSSSSRDAITQELVELCARTVKITLLSSMETLFFFSLDLFPVEHQTGEAASSQQGGAGGGKGEESGVVQ